jgi:hypothetical protein
MLAKLSSGTGFCRLETARRADSRLRVPCRDSSLAPAPAEMRVKARQSVRGRWYLRNRSPPERKAGLES